MANDERDASVPETPSSTATAPLPGERGEPKKDSEALFIVSVIAGLLGILGLLGALLLYVGGKFSEGDDTFFQHLNKVLAVGLFLTVLAIGLQFGRILDALRQRRSMIALNVILMAILALTLVVLVNYVGSRRYRQFDWTSEGIYSISDETKKVIENVDRNIVVYLLLPGGAKQQEIEQLRRLVAQLEERSPKIKNRHVDPSVDPKEFERVMRELGLTGRTLTDVFGVAVQSGSYDPAGVWKGDRMKHIPVDELYEMSGGGHMGGEQPQRVFKGEQMIASAILEVSEEKKPKLYFLEGHQEFDLEGMGEGKGLGLLSKLLRQKNYECASLKLLEREKQDVPADADAIVIAGPQRALAPVELQSIETYLKAGGHALVMLDPALERRPGRDDTSFVDLGIEALLKKWNVDVAPRAIVGYERIPFTNPPLAKPSPVCWVTHLDMTSPITKPLMGLRCLLYEARPLKTLTTNAAVKTTEIAKTVESNLVLTTGKPDQFYETGNAKGLGDAEMGGTGKSFTVAVTAEQELDGQDKPQDKPDEKKDGAAAKPRKATRLIVVGDSDWASNGLLEREANLELMNNAVSWLVGQKRFVSQSKRPHSYKLDLSQGKVVLFQLAAFPGLPSIAVLLGVLVWIIRRRG